MELDPGIHIVMHSVLFLKPGVTVMMTFTLFTLTLGKFWKVILYFN
jgi:hypothetical protein